MPKGFAFDKNSPASKVVSCADATALTEQLQDYFSEIEDPRVERTRAHGLRDILVMAVLAVIAGALLLRRHRELRPQQTGLVSAVFRVA